MWRSINVLAELNTAMGMGKRYLGERGRWTKYESRRGKQNRDQEGSLLFKSGLQLRRAHQAHHDSHPMGLSAPFVDLDHTQPPKAVTNRTFLFIGLPLADGKLVGGLHPIAFKLRNLGIYFPNGATPPRLSATQTPYLS